MTFGTVLLSKKVKTINMPQYKHQKKMEMIHVCEIICMLHYQELTRKSISISTVKYHKTFNQDSRGEGRVKEPTTEQFNTSHSISICNIYLYNIIYRRFVQVSGFKTVGTSTKNTLFLSDISPEQYQGILKKTA